MCSWYIEHDDAYESRIKTLANNKIIFHTRNVCLFTICSNMLLSVVKPHCFIASNRKGQNEKCSLRSRSVPKRINIQIIRFRHRKANGKNVELFPRIWNERATNASCFYCCAEVLVIFGLILVIYWSESGVRATANLLHFTEKRDFSSESVINHPEFPVKNNTDRL